MIIHQLDYRYLNENKNIYFLHSVGGSRGKGGRGASVNFKLTLVPYLGNNVVKFGTNYFKKNMKLVRTALMAPFYKKI